jgi:predicted amidohydrolase YtcJ
MKCSRRIRPRCSAVRPSPEARRLQDHRRRLAAGPAGVLHDSVSHGRAAGEKNWVGAPTFPQDFVNASVKKCYDAGLQLLFHANGDAAIDSLLTAHEFAAAGSIDKDRRTIAIHAQFIRRDQLAKFARYRIIPSFFTDHTFFFADTHVKNRGKGQAYFISPMHSAYAAGLRPTNHTDYAVAPISQLLTMWTAVNRVSRSGEVIGPDERATPLQALQAITINVAYEYGEEASKGSLEPGKLVDLVILDRNPLKVDPLAIKDIRVVSTIKEGRRLRRPVIAFDEDLSTRADRHAPTITTAGNFRQHLARALNSLREILELRQAVAGRITFSP